MLIHQELNLAEHLDVAGNIFLGREPTWGGFLGFIDTPHLRRCRQHHRTARPDRVAAHACPAICRSASSNLSRSPGRCRCSSRLLILDEPTSSLTESETDLLFAVLRELKAARHQHPLYISHRLKEVEVDRRPRHRSARRQKRWRTAARRHQSSGHRAAHGRAANSSSFSSAIAAARRRRPPVIRVQGLRWSASASGHRLRDRAGRDRRHGGADGGGPHGTGGNAVRRAPHDRRDGRRIDGEPVTIRKPADAIRAGIFLIPEDRRLEGLDPGRQRQA